MLKVIQFVFNAFGEKTYVISDSETREAAVIDPGMMAESERREFDNYISASQLKIVEIINTHLHLDHF